MKTLALILDLEIDLEIYKGKYIISMKPNETISTTKIQIGEIEEKNNDDYILYSKILVKGTLLYFIIGSDNYKNLILAKVKRRPAISNNTAQISIQYWLVKP